MRILIASSAALALAAGAVACVVQPEALPPPAEAGGSSPVEDALPSSPAETEHFVVTEEVYSRTFDEIERFVVNLNEIIRREDYDTWVTHLSEDYVTRTSDPQYLREQSEQPLLRQNNVQLRSLRDYFEHVVVPSRMTATVDEIEFIDETHVRALTAVRSTRAVLYLLIKEDGGWKIGVW